MIAREILEEMFDDMRKKSKWHVDGPLLWGYFFTATDGLVLEQASDLLVRDGYSFVDIWEGDATNDAPAVWWLHVERVEHHTVDSLLARNESLDAFAARNKLVSYDGMDVGPAPPQ
jgi:hypothetical protein